MLNIQPLEINDFSGGITDYYVGAAPNRAEVIDNLFILPNKTLQTRGGSVLDDTTNEFIPSGNKRIGALINYNNSANLLVQSEAAIYYRNTSAYTTLVGPTSNSVFSTGATTNYVSWSEWNRHLLITNDAFVSPQKIYKDGSNVLQVRTAGLPALATSPTVTSGTAGARSYVYAFLYYYTYTIGTQVFEDFGPVTQVSLSGSGDPSVNNNAITAVPIISNSTTDNYDTTVIKVYVYRTTNGGTTLYKIGSITNGTAVFTDNVSDATAATGDLIYITGGVLDNDPPPKCKFIHTVNGYTYYAHIKDGSEVFPNSYRQSVQQDPDSVPSSFEDEVEDEITGFSSAGGVPIVLCKRNIYRIEGAFDEFGQGFMTHVRISDTAGCVSNSGIVQAEGKIFWAGNDGFYVSDGYMVQKISIGLNKSYLRFIGFLGSNTRKIVGVFNENERRIYWSFQIASNATDNDGCIVLDLTWGIKDDSVFTSISGGTDFAPTALTMFNKKFYRADRRGFVFIHDDSYTTDPKINVNTEADTWATKAIIHTYRSSAFNFGTDMVRKWVPRVTVKSKNNGNLSLQVNAIVDDGRYFKSCKEIRYRGYFFWGDPEFVWGATANPTCIWGLRGILEQWRHVPRKALRCDYFQVEITNSYTVISNSDTYGLATFDNTANTAVLASSTYSWPSESVGYFLSTETDSYATQYTVSERTSASTLTVNDPNGTFPTGSKKWLLSGYRKNEILNLQSYVIHWAALTRSQPTFSSSQLGTNS